MAVILAIVCITLVLIGYVMIEKRISLRPCLECGFRVALDGPNENCPRCGMLIPRISETDEL